MDRSVDVVIVGGGIGGSALATVLARNGLDVVVLEQQERYRDRVRGEVIMPWGAAEVERLGLTDVLIDAGGRFAPRSVNYDEIQTPAEAEQRAVPADALIPGIAGFLNVGHPEACEALAVAAAAAGAEVERGVTDIEATFASPPRVVFTGADGQRHAVSCRLVVGADGRGSGMRRQAGIGLEETTPRTFAGGMLARVEGLPDDRVALGTEGEVHYLMFPRTDGLVRLYLLADVVAKGRFTGADRQRRFLASFRLGCLPFADAIVDSTPMGPCIGYPMTDSWCEKPFAPGVVLIGDAAGWNDPIIGQGLSVTMRDTRTVADVLTSGSDWSPAAFADYATERTERMRRLRISASLMTDIRCTFTPEGRARRGAFFDAMMGDPLLMWPLLCELAGPESAPPEAFEDANIERILAIS